MTIIIDWQSKRMKEKILKKAESLYLRLGIRSVSMDDICRELGISKKTLYQYFENKDGLVKTVMEAHLDREKHKTLGISESSANALEELNKIGLNITENVEGVSPSTLYDLQKYYPMYFNTMMKKQNGIIFSFFHNNILRGIEEGHYRKNLSPDIVAHIFSKISYVIIESMSNPDFTYSRKKLIEELYDYHVHGIATKKGLETWSHYKPQSINK